MNDHKLDPHAGCHLPVEKQMTAFFAFTQTRANHEKVILLERMIGLGPSRENALYEVSKNQFKSRLDFVS